MDAKLSLGVGKLVTDMLTSEKMLLTVLPSTSGRPPVLAVFT